jgi:hypothetical protein
VPTGRGKYASGKHTWIHAYTWQPYIHTLTHTCKPVCVHVLLFTYTYCHVRHVHQPAEPRDRGRHTTAYAAPRRCPAPSHRSTRSPWMTSRNPAAIHSRLLWNSRSLLPTYATSKVTVIGFVQGNETQGILHHRDSPSRNKPSHTHTHTLSLSRTVTDVCIPACPGSSPSTPFQGVQDLTTALRAPCHHGGRS